MGLVVLWAAVVLRTYGLLSAIKQGKGSTAKMTDHQSNATTDSAGQPKFKKLTEPVYVSGMFVAPVGFLHSAAGAVDIVFVPPVLRTWRKPVRRLSSH
ncbi:MAG: hypothetical protein AAB919_03335 [Patescibacteria group bacterium]